MKIIIGIDGSKQSEAAMEACAKFVKSVTEVKIITVIELNYAIASEPFAASAELYGQIEENERKNAEERVAKAKIKLGEIFGDSSITITSDIVNGIPGQVIVEEAENWKADLIIVGSHGYGFWKRAMIGSVSDAIIHHAPCSVLVVRTPE